MEDVYKTMYLHLFNGISDITQLMKKSDLILPDYLKILDMLKQLQIKAELEYMTVDESEKRQN